jgi:hypothetical protein
MREQLGKPIPSPVVLGQVTKEFREAVKAKAEQEQIPVYQFQHKDRKDGVANHFRRQRAEQHGVVHAALPVVSQVAYQADASTSSSTAQACCGAVYGS